MTVEITRTRAHRQSCRAPVRSRDPATAWPGGWGTPIEKPFERSPLELDSEGTLDYTAPIRLSLHRPAPSL